MKDKYINEAMNHRTERVKQNNTITLIDYYFLLLRENNSVALSLDAILQKNNIPIDIFFGTVKLGSILNFSTYAVYNDMIDKKHILSNLKKLNIDENFIRYIASYSVYLEHAIKGLESGDYTGELE